MSASDLFWEHDPLPVQKTAVVDICEQCWRPAYGSVPGHVFCREHFLDHQRTLIAEMVAKRQQGAA